MILEVIVWIIRSAATLIADLAPQTAGPRGAHAYEDCNELARIDDVLDAWLGDGIGVTGL
jgi:hypothetical protein